MRSLITLAMISVALGTDERVIPWEPGAACRQYQDQAEHYATALELISDCVKLPTDAQSMQCTQRVLAEAEL